MIGMLFTIATARTKEWNSPRSCQPHRVPSPLLVIRQGDGARPTQPWAAEKMCPAQSSSLHFWPLGRPASLASRHLPFLRFLREGWDHMRHHVANRADLRAYPMSFSLR
ncbi:hypothetical protein GQ607_000425 [Colletotrichum asianum]|uniref:Uncharacterized protein n=1 Tax=Colletotrichum asianum TaxID=702518 RepID=A0A8H3ZTW5_9PEZI|nr:hypothetical protein GQ607_000425 [Colletotrichum asianum]